MRKLGRGHRRSHVLRAPRLRWGGLRRTTPLYEGWSRGGPVDRVYIETFLLEHRDAIRGEVLEVQSTVHTDRYGHEVTGRHVLDMVAGTGVTVVADLSEAESLPERCYDCIVLPQTLQFVRNPGVAVRNLHRALRPGGSLLLTVPGITRTAPGTLRPDAPFRDLWRWTAEGLEVLLSESFGPCRGAVEHHGNVLSAVAFLHGLGAAELRPEEYERVDRQYPVVVAAHVTRVL